MSGSRAEKFIDNRRAGLYGPPANEGARMRRGLTLIVVLLLWISVPAAQTPARIVSTSPSITETLFALGLGNQVVGVST